MKRSIKVLAVCVLLATACITAITLTGCRPPEGEENT